MDTVFFESTSERHAQVIGGLTALERRIREVARQGAARAVVAASPAAHRPRERGASEPT